MLLKRIHSLVDQPREYITFKASRAVRNVFENSTAKDINTCVYESGGVDRVLFHEGNHAAVAVHVDCSISFCVLNKPHRYAYQSSVFAMKANQLAKIDLNK